MAKLGVERVFHDPDHWEQPHHQGVLKNLNILGMDKTLFDFMWQFKKGRNKGSHGGAGGFLTVANFEAEYLVDFPSIDTNVYMPDAEKKLHKDGLNVVHQCLTAEKSAKTKKNMKKSAKAVTSGSNDHTGAKPKGRFHVLPDPVATA